MRRLVWAFTGRTYHIVGNLMSRLNYVFVYQPVNHQYHWPYRRWVLDYLIYMYHHRGSITSINLLLWNKEKVSQTSYLECSNIAMTIWESLSYGVYISQLIRFARASSYFTDFNTRNKLLTQKLLKQGYRYHKLRKTFSKFYRRSYDLISKFQVGLKSLLRQGLSEPELWLGI